MYTEDPESQTLLVFYAHICTSGQMYKCVLEFALLDMVFDVPCKNAFRIVNEPFKFTVKEMQQTRPLLMYNTLVTLGEFTGFVK